MRPQIFQPFRQTAPWQRTLYIMFVAQLISAVGFSNIFPFLPLYVKSLGATTSLSVELLSGLVFSAQAITMTIASPFWGALADRYGRKLMVQRAMFGGALILLAMAFVRSAEELVLVRAVQGMITGTLAAANALVAAAAPRERTGYAMGLLQVGLWAGLAIGPLLGGLLADAFGYRMAFVVTAALLLLAGLLVWWGVTEEFVPPEPTPGHSPSFWQGWQHVLRAQGVLVTYALRFLSSLGRTMIVPIAPLFIQALLGNSAGVNTFTGLVVGLASAASTATAIYMGRLGDTIGHRRVLLISAGLAGLFYLPQTFVTAAWQLLLLQALTGAAAGGIIPALSALLAQFTEPGEEGSVYGLDNSIVSASRAVAPLVGAGVAMWLGLRSAFALAGLIFLLIAGLALWKLGEQRPDSG